jgi:hypothetical protein
MVLATGAARADPTKDECINANESAQGLRASGKLREAEGKLAVCVAHGCPGPVRNDCSERLDEVQKALPTVVFAVRSARGEDLTAVRVLMDGAPLTASLGGSAVTVDPGSHRFTFDADGYASLQEEILVREGEKERAVSVVLRADGEARTPQAPPGAEQPGRPDAPHGLSTRRWAAIVTMGAGAVVAGAGGIIGLAARSAFDRADQESGIQRHVDSVSAVNTGNAATVVACTGGLLVASGAVLWLTAPGAHAQVGASAGQLLVKASFW